MVHRDIKPGNLMLSRQGNRDLIKVLDFGLAKVKSEGPTDRTLTHEGQMLGTPDFIAPEQISNARKADIRADIYSLGCTFYYLLTGGPPFQGDSLYEILQAHHSMEATPLNLVPPEVPIELAAVVGKMMAKEPERRFQEPKQVAQALLPFFKKGSSGSVGSKPEVSRVGQAEVKQPMFGMDSMPTQPAPGMASTPACTVNGPPQLARPEPMWESLVELRETKPVREVAPVAAWPRWKRRWDFWRVIVAASMFGAAALGVVLYLSTNKGRIKIEVDDPDVVVTLDDRETFRIEGLGEPIMLSVGDHEFKVKRGDLVVRTRNFSVRRGENEPLRVELKPKELGSHEPAGSIPTSASKNHEAAQPRANGAAASPNRQAHVFHGSWRVEGEDLVQVSTDPGGKSLVFGDEWWSNYDFEVEVKGIGGINVWVFFHFQDGGNSRKGSRNR